MAELTDRMAPVETSGGPVQGTYEGGIARYLGIRYAEPPVGPLRWKPPVPIRRRPEIFDASSFGPDAMQRQPPVTSRATAIDEDCLRLNIWAPPPSEIPRAVMVWFYGGSFVSGSASDGRVDGTAFAEEGVIYVSVTSRVGIFGWLAHSGMREESPHDTAGNFGLMDQIEALRWIKANIAAFGGDPYRVTVFGVSSGGAAISLLMTSPEAEGLFHRAILQSPGAFRPLAGLDDAIAAGDALGDLATLRELSAADVLALEPKLIPAMRGLTTPRILRPIIDGWIVPMDERLAFERGAFARIPVIVGSNADEGSRLTATWPVETLEALSEAIEANFPLASQEAASLYPAAEPSNVRGALADMFGDTQFQLGAREIARWVEAHGSTAFRYVFKRRRGGGTEGPHHGGEVCYVFRHLDLPPVTASELPTDSRDERLAEAFHETWARFAAQGLPGSFDGVAWPRASEGFLDIGEATQMGLRWRDDQLDFLNRYARLSTEPGRNGS